MATGTDSRTRISRSPCGGTDTVEPYVEIVCGLPWSSVSATLNVAHVSPKFVSLTSPVPLKSRLSSYSRS